MVNIRLKIEYDGRCFRGWQHQPGLRTIESELQRVLPLVLREQPKRLSVSGRTDAGVHARGQVINFHVSERCGEALDLRRFARSISCILKDELAVLDAQVVPDDFNSRFSARDKQYSYAILWREAPAALDWGKCWHVSGNLNVALMMDQARLLEGTHDFSSFRGSRCMAASPVREIISSRIFLEPPFLIYRVVGTGFLKQMVRNIVGTLVGMGRGMHWSVSVLEVLSRKDRRSAGVTAPPQGLSLDWVRYDIEWPEAFDRFRGLVDGR